MPSDASWLFRNSLSVVFPELLNDLVCLLRSGQESAAQPPAGTGPTYPRVSARQLSADWGRACSGFPMRRQNEPELISSLKIVGRPGGSKLKFRLCLRVIAQSPVHHAEQDVPRGIVRFLAHVIAGRRKRISICGYVHQRLDLRGQRDRYRSGFRRITSLVFIRGLAISGARLHRCWPRVKCAAVNVGMALEQIR